MDQKSVFLAGEADRYFERNAMAHERYHSMAMADPGSDPVLAVMSKLRPARILEVGCADGWKLDVARQLWGISGIGIDPSEAAICRGSLRYPGVVLSVGTAERLPVANASIDCVIFGFCLYLCDRRDLFRIAAEADRALCEGGHIIVSDFFAAVPHRNPYSHRDGVFSYKMDYSRLWSWHPAYRQTSQEYFAHEGKDPDDPNERLAVTVLHKDPI